MSRPFSQMAATITCMDVFLSTRIGLTYLVFELLNPLEIEQFQLLADKKSCTRIK